MNNTHLNKKNSEISSFSSENMDKYVDNLKKAATIHKDVRKLARNKINVGIKASELIKFIEDECKKRIVDVVNGESNINTNNPFTYKEGSLAFPVGVSINNCVAHWTWNGKKSHDKIFKSNDIIKIDFGVNIGGAIVDSAFTHIFNNKYQPLLDANKEVLKMAIDNAGVDSRLQDMGTLIEEMVNSYEIEIDDTNKTYQLKSVMDVCGHSIGPYRVHDGKAFPNIDFRKYKELVNVNYPHKIEDGEYYAIEPFLSTGKGRGLPINGSNEPCTHFAVNYLEPDWEKVGIICDKRPFNYIRNTFGTMPFTQRWMDNKILDANPNKFSDPELLFKKLKRAGHIIFHPPIYDVPHSIVSQFEHNVLFMNEKKIVITEDDDY